MQDKGVLVASDLNTEWLLSWWWERYSSYNNLPVVFVDLGMSLEGKKWCEERGEVLPFSSFLIKNPLHMGKWENIYGKSYQTCRNAWFKKPGACQLTPFLQTVWIDLDCEILSSLEEIFLCLDEKELAVNFGFPLSIPEGLEDVAAAGLICNSGVIVFQKESPLMKRWAQRALTDSDRYFGDECILSSLIFEAPEKVALLPESYNWRISRGVPFQAKIIHWKGEWGKAFIKKHGGLLPLLQKL